MPKLHMFYLGGTAPQANIELHDIQFAAVDHPEEAYEQLKKSWFGDLKYFHIDGYMVIDWINGYDVLLSHSAPHENNLKLYFVNLGGYQPQQLAELHEFGLFVASESRAAKHQALQQLLPNVEQQHKDDLVDVEGCLALDKLNGYFIHLIPNPNGTPAKPIKQGYHRI